MDISTKKTTIPKHVKVVNICLLHEHKHWAHLCMTPSVFKLRRIDFRSDIYMIGGIILRDYTRLIGLRCALKLDPCDEEYILPYVC